MFHAVGQSGFNTHTHTHTHTQYASVQPDYTAVQCVCVCVRVEARMGGPSRMCYIVAAQEGQVGCFNLVHKLS